jgi:hypothetical protein
MNDEGITGEDEVTRDADPEWLAALRWRDESDAADTPAGPMSNDDAAAERTTEADADLVELVRAARQQARAGLAAPPRPDDSAMTADAPPTPADEPANEAPPAPAPTFLPPPTQADFGRLAFIRASDPPDEAEPPNEPDPPAATPSATLPGRWQPPARLRPAEVPSTGPLLGDAPARRRRVDWRWLAVGIAAVVTVVVVIAMRGGDDRPPPATDPSGSTISTGSEPPSSDAPITVSVP